MAAVAYVLILAVFTAIALVLYKGFQAIGLI